MISGFFQASIIRRFRKSLFRHLRRVTVCLLMVPLLFNIVGGMALANGLAGSPFNGGDLPPRVVMVCTVAGMVAIDLDGTDSGNASPTGARGGLCPFCLPLMHSGADIAPSMTAIPVLIPMPSRHGLLPSATLLPPSVATTPSPARAPPETV